MVLKLRLDFSWISFCSKIVADQDWNLDHLWNIISEPLNQIFKEISNSKFEKFENLRISRCENNEKWLLKLSFLVLISVKKRQVKSHLRSKPDFNIDLIHFHYHQVQKSSENGRFWPEIWKISKFPEISWSFWILSGLKLKWYQENVVIWLDFLMKFELGEISKMLA